MDKRSKKKLDSKAPKQLARQIAEKFSEEEMRARIAELEREMQDLRSQVGGLLGKFILDKSLSYAEPSRKGTAKGEPIGFSKAKYQASLYMLRDYRLKEIGDVLHISYGLVRKWRTEPTFKKAVAGHIAEFIPRFEALIHKVIKDDDAFFEKFINKEPLETLAAGEIRYPAIVDLSDINHYSLELRGAVIERLASRGIGENNSALVLWVLTFCDFFEKHPAKDQIDLRFLQTKRELSKRLMHSMLTDVIDALKKPDISEAERRQAIFTLATVREYL